MAKIDARDWVFEIQTGPTAWAEIDGINTWELDPNAESASSDDTTFKSKGRHESRPMQRGASISLEGFREVDDADPTEYDPGQARVDALAELVGESAKAGFRFRHEAQELWTVWTKAWVEPGGIGGGNNDNTSWSATIMRSGGATTAAVTP